MTINLIVNPSFGFCDIPDVASAVGSIISKIFKSVIGSSEDNYDDDNFPESLGAGAVSFENGAHALVKQELAEMDKEDGLDQ